MPGLRWSERGATLPGVQKIFARPRRQNGRKTALDEACEAARQAQLKLEAELEAFFKEKGLKVYAPDIDAFRKKVQAEYLNSKFAKDWPPGLVEKINAIK